jgi:hypothetical protein
LGNGRTREKGSKYSSYRKSTDKVKMHKSKIAVEVYTPNVEKYQKE